MFDKTARIPKILLWIVMTLSVLVLLGYLFVFDKEVKVDIFITWGYILFALSTITALVFPFMQVFTNAKALKSLALVLVLFAVLVFGAYVLADDTPLTSLDIDNPDNVPSVLKFAGTGLYMTYFLLGIAVFGILFSEISKRFK